MNVPPMSTPRRYRHPVMMSHITSSQSHVSWARDPVRIRERFAHSCRVGCRRAPRRPRRDRRRGARRPCRSVEGRAAPAVRQGAEVFAGLGTWIDVYDTASTARRTALRGASPRAASAPRGSRRRTTARRGTSSIRPGSARSWTRSMRAGSRSSPGTSPVTTAMRATSAARARCSRSGRRRAARSTASALDVESLRNRNVRLRTEPDARPARPDLESEAGGTPVAAITYPPRAFERHLSWWPSFPWAEIAAPRRRDRPDAVHRRRASRDTTRRTATSRDRSGSCATAVGDDRSPFTRPAASRTG